MDVFAKLCLYILLLNRTLLVSSLEDGAKMIVNDKSKRSSTDFAASENIKHEKPLATLQPSASEKVMDYIAKGNELKNQYGFLIPKLIEMKLHHGSQLNIFLLTSYIPYIMLALQKANAPPENEKSSKLAHGLDDTNLTNLLQNPATLRKLFVNTDRGQLATDSVKLLAGNEASALVDKLIDELKKIAAENGDRIDGENMLTVLRRPDTLKKLFGSDEVTSEAVNLLNAYMESYLSSGLKEMKISAISQLKVMRTNRGINEGGNKRPVIQPVLGTLSDSLAAFFKFGYKKISEKMENLNLEAEKSVADWKQMADGGNNSGTPAESTVQYTNVFINNAPNAVLKTLAAGQVLTTKMMHNQYHVIPSLAHYFLPTGLPMDVFKFLCLVTYVMVKAQRENMIPDIDTDKLNNISGLNTERVVDTLNNNNIMTKIFPENDHSNVKITMLKFLAGPEAYVVDMLVVELKKLKKEKGDGKLTINNVLTNSALFIKLSAMKQYTDMILKKYLGIDIGRLQTEIMSEYNKINISKSTDRQENVSIYNAVSRGTTAVSNLFAAAYRVGKRKVSEQIVNINHEIGMNAQRMTQAPQNPSGVGIGAGLVRKAAGIAPTSVLYGVAGAKMAADRLAGLFWWVNDDYRNPTTDAGGPTDDDDKSEEGELQDDTAEDDPTSTAASSTSDLKKVQIR